MSDDTVVPLPPGRAVDIPARFIRQAYEHLQHSGERYVTFIFAGEMVADAVCYGISTQRVIPSRLITDQSSSKPQPPPKPSKRSESPRSESSTPSWSLDSITGAVVLEVVRRHGPINNRMICDRLGIARGDMALRQRTHRVLASLVKARAIRRSGDKRFPDYVVLRARRSTDTQTKSDMGRKDVTEEMVLEQLQTGPISSRSIGDNLGIERANNHVRSKITEIVGKLMQENRLRHVSGNIGTGRMYELIEEENQQTTG